MRRHEQREHIFKLLFMTQFNEEGEMPEQLSLYFDSLEELTEEEQAVMKKKYDDILAHIEEIDQELNEYSQGWKTSRMNRVDLTALRLAFYEMKFDEEIPVGVAINEAVERSCAQNTSSFPPGKDHYQIQQKSEKKGTAVI